MTKVLYPEIVLMLFIGAILATDFRATFWPEGFAGYRLTKPENDTFALGCPSFGPAHPLMAFYVELASHEAEGKSYFSGRSVHRALSAMD
jgi:hypothetical protein